MGIVFSCAPVVVGGVVVGGVVVGGRVVGEFDPPPRRVVWWTAGVVPLVAGVDGQDEPDVGAGVLPHELLDDDERVGALAAAALVGTTTFTSWYFVRVTTIGAPGLVAPVAPAALCVAADAPPSPNR